MGSDGHLAGAVALTIPVLVALIAGRELSVPVLEAFPGQILDIVEHTFDLAQLGAKYNVYDYAMKQGGAGAEAVGIVCPAPLSAEERQTIIDLARRVFRVMSCPDFGRVDIRLREDGTPFFIELNPLPSLHPAASLLTAARARGLETREVFRLMIRSAARRHGLPLRRPRTAPAAAAHPAEARPWPTLRELGVAIGRYPPGVHNAITDVKGVRVGHVTRIEDGVAVPGTGVTTSVRTGVTAILPAPRDVFKRRLVAGGFVLNGVGEMAGLTQVLEWGWLESPILLTNTASVGRVHAGVAAYLHERHPRIGEVHDVVLPDAGETDDSFLNDIRSGLAADRRRLRHPRRRSHRRLRLHHRPLPGTRPPPRRPGPADARLPGGRLQHRGARGLRRRFPGGPGRGPLRARPTRGGAVQDGGGGPHGLDRHRR